MYFTKDPMGKHSNSQHSDLSIQRNNFLAIIKILTSRIYLPQSIYWSDMSIRAISLCVAEHSFQRSGNLQGMVTGGIIRLNDSVEATSGQEVLIPMDNNTVLVLTGLLVNGLINGKEFHSPYPSQAFGIIGWLFQTDIRRGYIGEPIIGR